MKMLIPIQRQVEYSTIIDLSKRDYAAYQRFLAIQEKAKEQVDEQQRGFDPQKRITDARQLVDDLVKLVKKQNEVLENLVWKGAGYFYDLNRQDKRKLLRSQKALLKALDEADHLSNDVGAI